MGGGGGKLNVTNTERKAIMSENDRQHGREDGDSHTRRKRVSFSISASSI